MNITASYRRHFGSECRTLPGYGGSLPEAVWDADSRLPVGRWVRVAVSSAETILNDLRGVRSREVAFFEGRTVFANPATRSAGVGKEIL